MKLYRINDNYLNYLRNFDSRVPQIKTGNVRPFVGVILSINGISYFAPLSSQKKNNRPDFKVSQGGKQIATVRTAFMLPIPECAITEIDFASERSKDPKYTSLLINEINFIFIISNSVFLGLLHCIKATHIGKRRIVYTFPPLSKTQRFFRAD